MSPLIWTLKQAKRLIVVTVGLTVLGIGIAMIVLPGPAIVVIPVGLGILATEFVWARNLLHKIKERLPKRASKVHPTELGGN
ncbi:MAG: PGPGW domain-containing protein [Deltaproteobacteria bacterium]|nr:PGPGW domain-containing protein [Deltaproteobacteria bacterium]